MKKRLKEGYEIFLQGKIDEVSMDLRLQYYLGILSHANQHKLSQAVKNAYWIRMPASLSQEQKNKKTIPFTKGQASKNQVP